MFEEQCFLHRNPLGLDALFRGLSRVGLLFNLLLPGFCLGVVTPSSCRMKGVQECAVEENRMRFTLFLASRAIAVFDEPLQNCLVVLPT